MFIILASLPPAVIHLNGTSAPVEVEIVRETDRLVFSEPLIGSRQVQFVESKAPDPLSLQPVPRGEGIRRDNAEPLQDTRLLQGQNFDQNHSAPDWRSPHNWVVAGTLRAAEVLKDPRSAQARRVLTMVTSQDRREQICALEAMEQVRADATGFQPDRLMPYALKNTVQNAQLIFAPAAALRSRRNWYEITYRCRLNAAGTVVEEFEYALGPPIPQNLWDDLGLAAVY
ncbi:DUF930 domain-containing protein [Labrenzia sp. PHM005]|uniref:DUF930 domain-containing protein n=1 Tax=Labrenzia sp. PHM005 TaxID=2590016 RepID=UPI001140600D|nr:DUF930 domain-containing protein [Labrenzia sp. PHM005]QDG78309.1 DUF930 domain-containing protein [Labrenzia sp. PHM005]